MVSAGYQRVEEDPTPVLRRSCSLVKDTGKGGDIAIWWNVLVKEGEERLEVLAGGKPGKEGAARVKTRGRLRIRRRIL